MEKSSINCDYHFLILNLRYIHQKVDDKYLHY